MKILLLLVMMALTSLAFSWDRYSNETEQKILGSAGHTYVYRYAFSIPANTVKGFTFETKNLPGQSADTYMHLWNVDDHLQVAKDDDSGESLCSNLGLTLAGGDYVLFIRTYISTPCSAQFFVNGVLVNANVRIAGTKVFLPSVPFGEARVYTKNITGDTYALYLNSNTDLIGFDDDSGGSLTSSLASPEAGSVVLGSYSPSSEGTCDLYFQQDVNLDYRTFTGGPQSILSDYPYAFNNSFNFGSSDLSGSSWQLNSFMFRQSRIAWADGVDLVTLCAHGGPGILADFWYNNFAVTGPSVTLGSGDRSNNERGDLEYLAILGCNFLDFHAVSITYKQLVDSGFVGSAFNPGLFAGLHLIVGYSSEASILEDHNWGGYFNTATPQGNYFADNLDAGQTVWDAWKHAQTKAADDFHGRNWFTKFDMGETALLCPSIYQNERVSDFKSKDYIYGDAEYDSFVVANYHYYY